MHSEKDINEEIECILRNSKKTEITLDEILSMTNFRLTKDETIAALRATSQGKFVVGRRGAKTRIVLSNPINFSRRTTSEVRTEHNKSEPIDEPVSGAELGSDATLLDSIYKEVQSCADKIEQIRRSHRASNDHQAALRYYNSRLHQIASELEGIARNAVR